MTKKILSVKRSKKIFAVLCAVFMFGLAWIPVLGAANSMCPAGGCGRTGTLIRQYDMGTECNPNAASPCRTRWVSVFECKYSGAAQWRSCQYCGRLR